MNNEPPSLMVHGGAGRVSARITDQNKASYLEGLLSSVRRGVRILRDGGPAIQAVEAAVSSLEDNDCFNAGRGSVFSADGRHYLSASIMCGKSRRGGSVAGLEHVKNPVALARAVLEASPHNFLCGSGAERFAHSHEIEMVANQYFDSVQRLQSWLQTRDQNTLTLDDAEITNPEKGTVGAVARDKKGMLAAATSTGGLGNQQAGRVPDSAITGMATYANNTSIAVSCTGRGEAIMDVMLAYELHIRSSREGTAISAALTDIVQNEMTSGTAGVIVVDTSGRLYSDMNTEGMFRAWFEPSDGLIRAAIWDEVEVEEKVIW